MSSSTTKNSKEDAGNAKKRMNLSGSTAKVEAGQAANVGVVRRIAGRKKLTPRRGTDRANTNSRRSVPLNDNAPMTSMFGDNTEVSGGQFIIAETVNNVNSSEAKHAFKLLQKRVAPSAFHNSAQRVDPPRCHPETRKEILKRIYDWITQSAAREEWLLWLNGAAGAGKSAIMQSIAEKCALTAIALASFFFFRGDPTRNTIAPLVATLAYQLIQAIPETAEHILLTVEFNPLIFDQSLEDQLHHLIILPLLRLPKELQRLFVVLIDGLDECGNQIHQANLVKVLGDVSSRRNIPVVFLLASRREPQIEAAFVQKSVSGLLSTLPLDHSDVEQTSNDILRFLNDRFEDIKETHLYKNLIPPNWPPPSIVDDIVAKSSGQFIFASVVISYLSSPRKIPTRQLEFVHDIRLREASSQNPFAHLDALYRHIFSQVEALDMVLDILALALFTRRSDVASFEYAFQLAPGELKVYLADLVAVIECGAHWEGPCPMFRYEGDEDVQEFGEYDEGEVVRFLHASLPDFLLDKSRAEDYYIDGDVYRTKLLCMLLEKPLPSSGPLSSTLTLEAISLQEHDRLRLSMIRDLLYYDNGETPIKATDRLRTAFMNFNFTAYDQDLFAMYDGVSDYTGILKYLVYNLDIDGWLSAYDHILHIFSVGYAKYIHEKYGHDSWSNVDITIKTFKSMATTKSHYWKLQWMYDSQQEIPPGSTCGFSCNCVLGTDEDDKLLNKSGKSTYIYRSHDPSGPDYICGSNGCRHLIFLPGIGWEWVK